MHLLVLVISQGEEVGSGEMMTFALSFMPLLGRVQESPFLQLGLGL